MDMMLLAETFATPPGIVVVLLLLTFLAHLKRASLGAAMLVVSFSVLVALSLPGTAHWLMAGLEQYSRTPQWVRMAESGPQSRFYVPADSRNDPPQAIVVLGAGRYPAAPEYDDRDTVSALGLERLRYAAALQRRTGVPILVSGGSPGGETSAEADQMKAVLEDEFKVDVKWVERQSRNTAENARYSAPLLIGAKVRHVYLVTHAWHMRRAARHFESAGIRVTAAPTGFHKIQRDGNTLTGLLPSAQGMLATSIAIRERFAYLRAELGDSPSANPDTK